jgi:hypothetical protein
VIPQASPIFLPVDRLQRMGAPARLEHLNET